MKKLFLFVLCFCVSNLYAQNIPPINKGNDLAAKQLRGKVKTAESWTYNQDGFIISEYTVINGLQTMLTYTRDADNKITKITTSEGKSLPFTNDQFGRLAKFNGYTYKYDSNGELLSQSWKDNDWNYGSIQYVRNNEGLLIKIAEIRNEEEVGEEVETSYIYDGKGNLVKMISYTPELYTYEYDKNGNWIKQIVKYDEPDNDNSETNTREREIVYYE